MGGREGMRIPSRRQFLLGCGVGAAVLGIALMSLLRIGFFFPPPMARVPIQGPRADGVPWAGDSLRVMVWNVQYCASRKHEFFYDGGETVHVPREDVDTTMVAVSDAIRLHEPDVVLLQEVDRDSARTHRVDQLEGILQRTPYERWVAAPYHRVRYVPHPPGRHLGRVDMQLATLSRYELAAARRIQLPLLREPFYRRAFNLKRAVLEATIAAESTSLTVLNTHLSAFSFGDGTLDAQVERVVRRLEELDRLGMPWILAGDFNMLPPGDDPARLGDEASYYAETGSPIQRLFDAGHAAAPDPRLALEAPEEWRTYLPFGASTPDRTLDYLFASSGVEITSARVLQEYRDVYDHIPLLVEIAIVK